MDTARRGSQRPRPICSRRSKSARRFSSGSPGGRRSPSRWAREHSQAPGLVLVDGGYWDFADLPDFDTSRALEAWVRGAEKRAEDERYANWGATSRPSARHWAAGRPRSRRHTARRCGRRRPHRPDRRARGRGRDPPRQLPRADRSRARRPRRLEPAILLVTPARGSGPVGRAGSTASGRTCLSWSSRLSRATCTISCRLPLQSSPSLWERASGARSVRPDPVGHVWVVLAVLACPGPQP